MSSPPTPPPTPPRRTKRWDPVATLGIYNEDYYKKFTCLGFVRDKRTQKIRRCHLDPAAGNQPEVLAILENLAFSRPDFQEMEVSLERAAYAGLCGRWHNWKDPRDHIDWATAGWKTRMEQTTNHDERAELMITVQSLREERDRLQESFDTMSLENENLRRERDRLQEGFSEASRENEELTREMNEKDRLLERQAQAETERERAQQAQEERVAERQQAEDRKKDEHYKAQLEKERRSKQAVEDQRLAFELELRNEQTLRVERERRFQAINQQVQAEKNEVQQRLEKEMAEKYRLQRILEEQQAQDQTLQEDLQRERINFRKLMELHDREGMAFERLQELYEQERQQYPRLQAAFHSLREDQHQLLEEHDRVQRELRQVYQDSSDRAKRQRVWTSLRTRIQRLISRRTQGS
ncbi:MAG: hypothetical protein M1821_006800 [Bathelium mastoideum]|nr:MAG: hypothetical protein M1821_006800 [Bathelium mastoideum]